MDIHPAILAKDEAEFRRKVEHVRPLGRTVHVDVMDGKFVEGTTWASVDSVMNIMEELPFHAHMMVINPEHAVPIWAVSGAERVYFHIESTHREDLIIRSVADCSELGIVLNPETSVTSVTSWLDRFQSVVLDKIKEIRTMRPNMHIVVDGGVKPTNILAIAQAGADAVVCGSSLTDQDDPIMAMELFERELRRL
jgi:ribulose-phosphate 3-epimerase